MFEIPRLPCSFSANHAFEASADTSEVIGNWPRCKPPPSLVLCIQRAVLPPTLQPSRQSSGVTLSVFCAFSMPPRTKNTGAPSARPSRRPALTLTCSRCRARKVKCDGRTPECRICQAYGAQCHYDKLPAMSQVISMTQRIEELERMLASENSGHSEMDDVQETPRQAQVHRAVSSHRELASSSAVNRPSPQFESTSAVLDPANSNYNVIKDATLSYSGTEELSLISETQIDFWLSNAIAAASAQLHLPLNKVEHLFKTYLTWVFPVFLFISRPHFLLGARYSSPLLISVVCLQATRFTDHALKEELHSHVRLHLSQEIFREPSIPTVQALLQLSARDLGNGSLPQAWLYSGMAFRMAMDMGIFTRPRNPRDDPTDVAVRGHLAWSCFAWDKAVSLYLGRTPSLPEPPDFDPFVPDEALEEKLWSPHLDTYSEGVTALPVRCFGVSCFVNFCKLVVIINEILVTVYGKKPDRDPTLIRQIRGKLEDWWSNTPQHLRVEPTSQCPAPHVVSQK